jgi:hypothetical protein
MKRISLLFVALLAVIVALAMLLRAQGLITLASDNFNRADSNPIGAPWAGVSGTNNQILSNQFLGSANGANGVSAYDGGIGWPHDQWVQYTLTALSPSCGFEGVALDVSGSGRYQVGIDTGSTPGGIGQPFSSFIFFKNNPGLSEIGRVTVVPHANDVFLVEVVGQALTAFQNGVFLGGFTDGGAALPAGKAGLEASPYNGGCVTTNIVLDNFSAGTFSIGTKVAGPANVSGPVKVQ